MAGSQLPQYIFDVLSVWNGPWARFSVGPMAPSVTGTGGHDDMTITSLLNLTVNGAGGNDRIDASSITNGLLSTLNGGDGNDQIFGGGGVNLINGGDGHDMIEGFGGVDKLNGGNGADTLSYEHSNAGVTVNMQTVTLGLIAVSGGHATGDLVANDFENVVGSAFNDTITGDVGGNDLIGLGGDDTLNGGDGYDLLMGGAGADRLDGGLGVDTADYSLSPGRVEVLLANRTGGFNDASGDRYDSIENVTGSAFDDRLEGDRGTNELRGGMGRDVINGGDGDDILEGGSGFDQVNGGDGKDRIVFRSLNDVTNLEPIGYIDEIDDRVDFSLIDLDPQTAADEHFKYIGASAFTGGQFELRVTAGKIQLDVNGDKVVDYQLVYANSIVSSLPETCFIL
jgi:Ca2+-binding RTX toxin-like protein